MPDVQGQGDGEDVTATPKRERRERFFEIRLCVCGKIADCVSYNSLSTVYHCWCGRWWVGEPTPEWMLRGKLEMPTEGIGEVTLERFQAMIDELEREQDERGVVCVPGLGFVLGPKSKP